MSNATISTLISLLVLFLVARREMRVRTIVAGKLWIRPAIVVGITLLLAVFAVYEAPSAALRLVPWLAGGIAVGVATGLAVLRLTTVRPTERANAIVAQGSLATVGVWIVVLVVRILARFAFGGSSALANLDASVGTLAVVAAASTVVASSFHGAIVRRGRSLAA